MAAKKKASKKTGAKKKVSKKKVATKKKVSKKKASKKKVSKKKVAVKVQPRLKAIMKKQTKLQVIRAIAEDTDLTHKEVAAVFESLASQMRRHMQRRGSGEFVIPDTGVKIRRVRKPARKARMGRNPATGESIKIAAKPAYTAIKVSALKTLKETIK